jgi:hypothetical protein
VCAKPYRISLDLMRVCATCRGAGAESRQNVMLDALLPKLPQPSAVDDKLIGGDACDTGRRRPDVAWVGQDRQVHLEIDEDSHGARVVACELAKLTDTRWGSENGGKPLVTIRFNPDLMDPGANVPIEDRCSAVIDEITRWITCPIEQLKPYEAVHVVYMFYSSKGKKHIDAAKACTLAIAVNTSLYDLELAGASDE